MLYVPSGGDFRWQLHSHGTTRPAAAFGTTVTASASANTMGSWAGVITTPIANNAYMIVVNINSGALSASSRQALVDIGIDEAGGSSYTVKIPYLYATNASPYNVGSGGIWYVFPLFIPAGSTIAARRQSVVASSTCSVTIRLFGLPTRPETIRVGQWVEALGSTPASSSGTVITPGTTSDGAWTSLGSTARDSWWWQVGLGQNDTTTGAAAIHLDVSAGNVTNKKMLVENNLITNTTTEQQNNLPTTFGCIANADSSATIYARAQSSTTADSAVSVIVHALGG